METLQAIQKEKTTVALSSIGGAILITGMKIVVGTLTGSLGILAEAAHSGLDLVAALITYFAVKISDRPADETHAYGHGKVENISALAETLLLLVTCVWIIYEAYERLTGKAVHVEVGIWSFIVMGISIAVDYTRSRALYRVAKKYNSQALEADALHFKTDIWSSCVVILGLCFALFNIHVADSVAALIVAVIVIFVSLELGKRTIDDLVDRAPRGMEEEIRRIVTAVPGVHRTEKVRVRSVGAKKFIDLTVHIARTLPFAIAHDLVHKAERALQKEYPETDIIIHPEPVETSDETIIDKVKLLLSRERLTAHDVQAFEVNGRYQIEFQIEFVPDEKFTDAHERVTRIESLIKREIAGVQTVIIHIEDSRENVVVSKDVTANAQKLSRQIIAMAMSDADIIDCDVLSVLESSGEYRVSLACRVDHRHSLERVHEISTSIENRILVEFPFIKEVTIHAEPY
ncbi:MAG: cation diffusion facilitator family transporter [Acidobacteriota bacterium]